MDKKNCIKIKKSGVPVQLSGWLRTLDMVGVTGFEPAVPWSQTNL